MEISQLPTHERGCWLCLCKIGQNVWGLTQSANLFTAFNPAQQSFHFRESKYKVGYLVHLGNAFLVWTGAGVNPEVQWLKKSKCPVQVQVAKVSTVDIIKQVTQQLAPLVAAIPQVKACLQREQAGSAGDEVVGVMVDPRLPPFELTVGNEQPLLAQVKDTTTGIVRHPPQFPGADDAAPAEAN